MDGMRIDIVSDTHGYLSKELLAALPGADLIVHAGDICSLEDYAALQEIAPVRLCLGNNDWSYEYGPEVTKVVRFKEEGLRFELAHHRELLDLATCDVGICGHTHRAVIEKAARGALIVNPGSTTFPRAGRGPTIARLYVKSGSVLSAKIIDLEPKKDHGMLRWWG